MIEWVSDLSSHVKSIIEETHVSDGITRDKFASSFLFQKFLNGEIKNVIFPDFFIGTLHRHIIIF